MSDWIPWQKRSSENAEAFRKTQRESRARYRAEHEEEINRKKREAVAADPGKEIARMRAHRERYKEKYRQLKKEYVAENRGKYNALNAARRRGIKRHRLSWRFKTEIEGFYKEARRLTVETGVLHTVDHIWPINGENFCGLHLPWNLRVVTRSENSSKLNKRPDDSPSSVLDMELQDAEDHWCLHYLRREGKPGGPLEQYL